MLTSDLQGKRVVEVTKKEKLRKVGKVRSFVFHPSEKRVVGILVRRPDAAMMFHRKDVFVRLGAFSLNDEGWVQIAGCADATNRAAEKALGVDLDECVIWRGMPVMCEDGETLGFVGDISFEFETGTVIEVTLDEGCLTKDALLGRRVVPATEIRGFKKGLGHAVATEDGEWDEEPMLGAILVSDEVKSAETKGGLAEKAGASAAVTRAKVRVVKKKAQPKVDEATEKAGEVAEKALFATGRQLGRASGMFSAFKEEFEKARNEDD